MTNILKDIKKIYLKITKQKEVTFVLMADSDFFYSEKMYFRKNESEQIIDNELEAFARMVVQNFKLHYSHPIWFSEG
jgi:hypothetical protein